MSSGCVYLILPDETVDTGFLFARKCFLQCFARGESPLNLRFAYAGALDLRAEQEVMMAARATAMWIELGERAICYVDLGVTKMMRDELELANRREVPLEFRRLAGGRPSAEALHFQNVPHARGDCAICLGPQRVEELKKAFNKDSLTPEELLHLSTLPREKE